MVNGVAVKSRGSCVQVAGSLQGSIGNATDVLKMLVWESCAEDAELSESFELRFTISASKRDVYHGKLNRQGRCVDATDFAGQYGVPQRPATLTKEFKSPAVWALACRHWRDGNKDCKGISVKPYLFYNDISVFHHEQLLFAAQHQPGNGTAGAAAAAAVSSIMQPDSPL